MTRKGLIRRKTNQSMIIKAKEKCDIKKHCNGTFKIKLLLFYLL